VIQLTPAVWIGAGLVLAVLEMIIPGFVVIWFGIAGVITGILAFFVKNTYVQFGVFVSLSTVMVFFSQRIARRITHAEPESVGANRMVGVTGVVLQPIAPPGFGRVKVRSDEWRALATVPIAAGTEVRVTAVDGTHLIVEPLKQRS